MKIKSKNGNATTVGLGVVVAIIVIGLILLVLCTARVPAGYVAVQYNINSGVADDTLSQGWHLVPPGVKTTLYTVGLEQSYLTEGKNGDSKEDERFEASTKEGKAVGIDLTFTYQYDPERIPYVFTKFKGQSGEEVLSSFIKPNVISWTKEVVATYKISDLIGEKRAEANTTLTDYLANKFEPYGILISNASLINIDVDEETQQAINAKITAQQNAETQEINNQTAIEKAEADANVKTTTAQAEADALLIEAQAQADANKLLSDSLTPELIESQKIEKWNGDVPKVSGSSATIVDIGDVITETETE